MRLIDADKLNKAIKDKFGYSSATAYLRNMQKLSPVEVFKHIMRLIEEAPTIEERQSGKWINHYDDLFPAESMEECSICHEWQSIGNDDNFCPNCGAKMKGVEE